MPNYLELQISCLAGGSILQVHSLAEARAAEAWGAVAIFFSDLNVLSDVELDQLVDEVSLHPLCSPRDFPRLSAAYKARTPHHFALEPVSSWGKRPRSFAHALDDADIEAIANIQVDRPHLIICRKASSLPVALRERDSAGASTLLFVEVGTLHEGVSALRNGANGILLTRSPGQEMPDEQDQLALMHAVIEAPGKEWPKGKHVIGVLSHQGDYLAHLAAFEDAIADFGVRGSVAVREVRTKAHLDRSDAVVLPGGWSNLQTLFLAETGIDRALRSASQRGLPVLGTCAGMILCGSEGGRHTKGRVMLGLVPGTIDNNVIDGVTSIKKLAGGEVEDILFSNGPVLKDFSKDVQVLAETQDTEQVIAARHDSTFVFSYHDYGRTHPEFLKYCLAHWAEGRLES